MIVAEAAQLRAIHAESGILMDRQQQYQDLLQHRMARRDEGSDELLARLVVYFTCHNKVHS